MTTNVLSFSVSDANGVTTIEAKSGETSVKKIQVPTAAFDALSQITEPTSNKEVQQIVASACGWSLNQAGRCPKAAALLERVTHGYGVFNGVIAVMVGTNVGKSRFFQFNESLSAESKAEMLTRKKAEIAEAGTPVNEEPVVLDLTDHVQVVIASDEEVQVVTEELEAEFASEDYKD